MESVRQLMQGIIDYAGMFPPARLALEEALKNYIDYRGTPTGQWILKYFLCPTGELGHLAAQCAGQGADFALSVSAIGGGGQDLAEFLNAAGEDFRAVSAVFGGARGPQVKFIEFKVPPSLCTVAQMDAFQEMLVQTAGLIESQKCEGITPYYEISFSHDWADAVPKCIAAVADFNKGWPGDAGFRRCGVKIRTGGVVAGQFPSVEQVGLWIESCVGSGVAFKATAGLHHPFRHFSDETSCLMHGFVNIFLAAALAYSHRADGGVDRGQLLGLLNEERPEAFSPRSDGIDWNGTLITNEQITTARRELAHSYGSCSYLEPVEDLRNVGWLAAE